MTWLAILVPDLGEPVDQVATLVDGVPIGFGWPASVTDFETVVDDLAATVTKAAAEHPGSPIVPVGHGLGGMIVVRYTQRHPELVAALVLAAPVLGPWQGLDLLSEQDISVDGPYGRVDRETLRAIDECLTTIDFDHPLGDELPALWLHGDGDQLVPISDTRAGMDRIRGLRFEERIYPGTGHELPRDAAADIAEFAARVGRA